MTETLIIVLSCFVAFFIIYLALGTLLDLRQKKLRLAARISSTISGNVAITPDRVTLFQKKRSNLIEKKLHDYLGKFKSENWLQLHLYRSGLKFSLTQFIIIYTIVVLTLTFSSSFFLYWSLFVRFFFFAFLSILVLYFTLEFLKGRRQNLIIKHLPSALDIILRSLKAGYSVERTFVVVAKELHPSVGDEFQQIVDQINVGVSYEDALRHASERVHTSDFYFLSNALIIQRQTGGSLSDTLENILFLLQRRHEIRLKTISLSAEAKSTGMILGSVPIAIWIIVSIMKPEYLDFFFYDEMGSFLLKVVVSLLLLEVLVIKWLVNIKVE